PRWRTRRRKLCKEERSPRKHGDTELVENRLSVSPCLRGEILSGGEMADNGFRIIDADGHVLEPPTAMLRHAPEQYPDRIFHLEVRPDGSEVVHYAGHTTSANYLAVAGTGGMSKEERMRAAAGKLKYTEIKPGAFDPKARLAEVAIDDIQQSVVYPTLMLGFPGLPDAP